MKTSRVIATWRALNALLVARCGSDLVIFGGMIDPPSEGILITGVPEAPADAAHVTVGASSSKEETFILRVVVYAEREGQSHDQTLDRLEELGDLVQNCIRDSTTGRPTTYFATELQTNCTSQVVRWAPSTGGNPKGIFGRGDIDIQFTVRI